MKRINKKERQREIRIIRLIISILVIFIVLGLGVGHIIIKDKKYSERENRSLAQKPELSLENIVDGSFMEETESYIADQFPFRDRWITLKTISEQALEKKESNGVYKCKKKYLMEDIAVPEPDNLTANIDAINKLAKSNEVNTYMVVAPNAANTLSEYLPKLAPVANQDEQMNEMSGRLCDDIKWIDIRDTLSSHTDQQLYYYTDHHWTTLGAYYAFQQVKEKMKLEGDTVEYEPTSVCNDFVGTLASKSGFVPKMQDSIEIYVPTNSNVQYVVSYVEEQVKTTSVYDTSKLENHDKYEVFFGGNHSEIKINTTSQSDNVLMVIKDSYANCFIPFLIPYYKEIIVIDPRYYYGNIGDEISSEGVTDVLLLYNANTFFEDNSISGVLSQDKTIEETTKEGSEEGAATTEATTKETTTEEVVTTETTTNETTTTTESQ